MKRLLRSLVAQPLRAKLYGVAHHARFWGFREYCPACQRRASHFLEHDLRPYAVEGGITPALVVPNTVCPWCHAYLHHRLLWTVLPGIIQEITANALARKPRLLHFAPEKFSRPRLSAIKTLNYITTDYMRDDVNIQLDMCQLGLATESVDLIIASHVLEHVQDDKVALRELHRVLRPGGAVVLLVPLLAERSFQRDDIETEQDRLRYYGQEDHVRAYGIDFAERLQSAGFETTIIRASEFPHLNRSSYLLNVQGVLFLGRKAVEL
jgi:hypothetical protein